MPKTINRPPTNPAPYTVDMPGHWVNLTLGPHPLCGSAITATVECHAGTDDLCWWRGPYGGAPAWIDGPIPPEQLVPADSCVVTVHLHGTALYRYDGPPTAHLRSGPIEITYTPGNGYTWRYAEGPAL